MGNEQKGKPQAAKMPTANEIKTYIMIIQNKLNLFRNKKIASIKQKKKEIAKSLRENNLDVAKAKMDTIIREEDMITVYDILGPLCEILKERVTYILSNSECPPDLRAQLDSVIYSATRLEFEELHKLRDMIMTRYGQAYIMKADSNADKLVNVNLVEKLRIKPASDVFVTIRLKQLCKEQKIPFEFPMEVESDIPIDPINPGNPYGGPEGMNPFDSQINTNNNNPYGPPQNMNNNNPYGPPDNSSPYGPPPNNNNQFGPPPNNNNNQFGPPPDNGNPYGPPPDNSNPYGPPPGNNNNNQFGPPPDNGNPYGPPSNNNNNTFGGENNNNNFSNPFGPPQNDNSQMSNNPYGHPQGGNPFENNQQGPQGNNPYGPSEGGNPFDQNNNKPFDQPSSIEFSGMSQNNNNDDNLDCKYTSLRNRPPKKNEQPKSSEEKPKEEQNDNPYASQSREIDNSVKKESPSSENNNNDNPYQTQVNENNKNDNPFGGASSDNPFGGTSSDNPYGGAPSDNPFGGENNKNDNPYGGASSDNPYGGAPSDNPFGGEKFDNPYGETSNENNGQKESILNFKDNQNNKDNDDACDFPKND